MQKENDSAESEVAAEVKEEQTEGLSLRDSLEIALEADKDDVERSEKDRTSDPRLDGEARAQSDAGRDNAPIQASEEKPEPIPAPAEFNAEEKAAFNEMPRAAQEATIRLHRSRMARLSEIKEAAREYEHLKELAKRFDPYVKARGAKEPADVALQKALAFYFEANEDPRRAAAAILKAKNLPIPQELLQEAAPDPVDAKLSPLQDKVSRLESELAQKKQAEAASALGQVWHSFEAQTNAAGKPRFPDIQPDKGETGIRLASEIGSLVSGQTALSQDFIARVKARQPGATFETLITEAYRYLGGRVEEAEAPKTQPQNHIHKSNRAAASVPGRGAPVSISGPVRKFANQRDALAAALADLNGE